MQELEREDQVELGPVQELTNHEKTILKVLAAINIEERCKGYKDSDTMDEQAVAKS